MKRSGMVGALTVLAALVFAACGGVGGTDDLFSLPGNGGAGTTGSVGSGATTGPASSTTGSATASSSNAGTGTSSATSSSVASSTSASTAASSSSGGPPPQVACNGQPCQPGQICCFNPNGPGDHCSGSGSCAPGWAQLDCNGPEDCPGGVCCATVDVNLQVPYLGMACQASCNADNEVVVCSEQQQDVCPQGTQCQSSQSLGTGYRICWPG